LGGRQQRIEYPRFQGENAPCPKPGVQDCNLNGFQDGYRSFLWPGLSFRSRAEAQRSAVCLHVSTRQLESRTRDALRFRHFAPLMFLIASISAGLCNAASPVAGFSITSVLADGDPRVVLATIKALSEVSASGDPFWSALAQKAVSAQSGEFDRFLLQVDRSNHDDLMLVGARVPVLASRLDRLFSSKTDASGAASLTYDVLRNVETLSVDGQRALLGMRRQPGASAFIVEHASRFPAIKGDVIGLQESRDTVDQALAFDFAAAVHGQVAQNLVGAALKSGEPTRVRSAAKYLLAQTRAVVEPFAALIVSSMQATHDDDTWGDLLELQSTLDPEAGATLIESAGGLEKVGNPVRQAAALRAAGSSERVKPILEAQRNRIWGAQTPSCDLRIAGTEAIAKLLARSIPSKRTEAAVNALVLMLSYPGTDCSSPSVSRAMNGLNTVATLGEDHSIKEFTARIRAADMSLNAQAADWLSGAHETCRSLRASVVALSGSTTRNTRLIVSGLARCLGPGDPEFDGLIRTLCATVAEPTQGTTLLPILTALKGQPLTDVQSQRISDAAMTPGLDFQRVMALAELLAASARTAETLRVVDARIQGTHRSDGVDLFNHLIQAGADSPAILTSTRVQQLIELLAHFESRASTAQLLSYAARNDLTPTEIGKSLLQVAVDKDHPLQLADCLEFSLLGPFRSSEPALAVLVASRQPYESARYTYPACIALLAPGDGSRQTLQQIAWGDSDTPSELTSREPRDQLLDLDRMWSLIDSEPNANVHAAYQNASLALLERASALAPSFKYMSPTSIAALEVWQKRAKQRFPEKTTDFGTELWRRRAVLYSSAVPLGVAGHTALWGLLLVFYVRSPSVRAFIFYNRWARKALALGYMDVLLLMVPPVRRLLFAPLRESMLGALGRIAPESQQPGAYYGRSGVAPLALSEIDRAIARIEADTLSGKQRPDTSITDGIKNWSGRVLLIGPSGRGKTSFLRHHLTGSPRLPAIYLTADECSPGVLSAVSQRLGALGRDADLIASLISAGRLDVYIDGLNEVDQRTRTGILNFLADNHAGNLFVCSQQLNDGLPAVTAYYLMPLSRRQMSEFLESREPYLDPDATIRGKTFVDASLAFLDSFESPTLEIDTESAAQLSRLRSGFLATLANPMDLQSAADLLASGVEPDPFNLQQQQFKQVNLKYRHLTGTDFPAAKLASAVLEARISGGDEIDGAKFQAETAALLARKQVYLRTESASGGLQVAAYQFRHDKIRDFYTHFAFLGNDPTVRHQYARDDRFGGVYELLAKALEPAQAEDLKEYLLLSAVDSQDHRLSDRFVQHLRWRRLLADTDPAWMTELDPPEATHALTEFAAIDQERGRLESRLTKLKSIVDTHREIARIVTAKDSSTLLDRVISALANYGAQSVPADTPYCRLVALPGHGRIQIWALASAGQPTVTVLSALQSLILERAMPPSLLIINVDAALAPAQRDSSGAQRWAVSLPPGLIRPIMGHDLYRLLQPDDAPLPLSVIWQTLYQGPQ
jgi:hypothetical protein